MDATPQFPTALGSSTRLVYIVSAYKLPQTLIKLVQALDNGDDLFLIHVDLQSPDSVAAEMRRALASPNVIFLERHVSKYRSFGHVRTTLKGLSYLRDHNIDYGHVVLLTGQDYPIKPLECIHEFLAKNPRTTFMEYFPLPTERWEGGGMKRLTHAHYFIWRRIIAIPRKWLGPRVDQELPDGFKPFGGSGYWMMCKLHADCAMDYLQGHSAIVRFFERAEVPDELFFQTILLNSIFADDISSDSLRYVDWSRPTEVPAVMRIGDFPKLKSVPDLFARKFNYEEEPEIIDKLDAELLAVDPNSC